MLAVDASKFTLEPFPVDQWKANGVGLVICQAHPAGYGNDKSIRLIRAVAAAGLPWDAYVYQYLNSPDWCTGALATLDAAAQEGLQPRKLWLDLEDVDQGQGWTVSQRVAAIQRDLAACDARGLTVGIYSAAWWWNTRMDGGAFFTDRQLWAAQYDNVADTTAFTPFGGWSSCRIKQYAGSQSDGTDLDVLSAEEEADMPGVIPSDPTSDDPGWVAKKAQVVQIAGELQTVAQQLASEATRRSGPRRSVLVPLADGIRQRADAILS